MIQLDQDTVKRNYEELYRQAPIKSEEKVYQRAAELLGLAPGATVLDVGCGAGFFLAELYARGLAGAGIDISEEAVKQAKARAPKADIRVGPAEHLPWPDKSFDAVSDLGTLEHFLNMEAALKEQIRVAKPGAKFLLILPNSHYLLEFVYIWRTGKEIPSAQILERKDTRKGWEEFLTQHGLTIERVEAYNNLGDGWDRRGALIRKAIHPFIPLNLSWQFIFVCTAKNTGT